MSDRPSSGPETPVAEVLAEVDALDASQVDPEADDLKERDSLLGVPWSRLVSADGIRGLVLLGLALAILLWPARTDAALARLIGVALSTVTVVSVVHLLRRAEERTFWTMLGVAVGGGMAAALLARPEQSLVSVAQLVGLIVAGWVLVGLLALVRARQLTAWGVVRSVGLAPVAVLLLGYPETMVAFAGAVGAGLLGALGLLQLFDDDADEDDEPTVSPEHAPTVDEEAPGEEGDHREPWSVAEAAIGTPVQVLRWLRRRPDVAEERLELQEKLFFEGDTAPVRFARFCTLMLFASLIASVGVVVESTAVVIGAMLIAPLMVPLMGTTLSTAMGWPRRLRRAAGVAASGVVIAVLTGAVVGSALPRTVDINANTEVLSRTSPTIVDLAIAVAAGAAGAYALSRRDVSDSLPGVAVAIALVPPLTVAGLCWEQQAWAEGNGALLLFLTNAVAILLAGGLTFVLLGVVPLDRASAGQRRLRTVSVGLVSFAAVVVLLLILNGRAITQSELAQADLDQVLTTWTKENEDYRVIDQRSTADGTVVVDLAGPGEPPGLDQLVADLEGALGGDVGLRVTWIEQQQVTVDPDG